MAVGFSVFRNGLERETLPLPGLSPSGSGHTSLVVDVVDREVGCVGRVPLKPPLMIQRGIEGKARPSVLLPPRLAAGLGGSERERERRGREEKRGGDGWTCEVKWRNALYVMEKLMKE